MRHPRITIAAIVISVGAAVGGVAIATAAGGSAAAYSPRIDPSRTSAPSSRAVISATVHTEKATVNGKSEMVLVDAKGEPLYTFKADTATTSRVTGQLATLWPPLLASGTPTASGASGTLTAVPTRNGTQVAYNGHFLYSFVDDSPGHVTGQGVQDFFIATPDTGGSATNNAPSASSSSSGNSYGYGY